MDRFFGCVHSYVTRFNHAIIHPSRIVKTRLQWVLLSTALGVLGVVLILLGIFGRHIDNTSLQYFGLIFGTLLTVVGLYFYFCVPFRSGETQSDGALVVYFRRALGLQSRQLLPDDSQVLWSVNENYQEPLVYDPGPPETCEYCSKRRRHPSAPGEVESPRHRQYPSVAEPRDELDEEKSGSSISIGRPPPPKYLPLNRRDGLVMPQGDRPFPTETPEDSTEDIALLYTDITHPPAILRGHLPDCPKVIYHTSRFPPGFRYPQDTDERLMNDLPLERASSSVVDITTPTSDTPSDWWLSVVNKMRSK